MLNPNVPAWFEIPADDLDRAQRFYETILAQPLQRANFGGADMAVFPRGDKPNATGALVSMEDSLLGEKSCAYLVVKEPLRAGAVRRFLREQGVAEFKLPDRVECVDALPLTPVGKVDKKQLRQWLAERKLG